MAALKVFITGASSGIGQSLAHEYARQGATLGLVARRQELLLSLKNNLGVENAIYVADVRDEEALNKAAQHFMLQH